MRNPWRIARIMGINIGLDASWFIIFFLLIFEFGFVQFPRELRPRSFFARPDAISITLGVLASLLLFASVLAHELSHSWMAIRRGIPVVSITLFIFGGVAQISDEPDRPATEFLIAIMGPVMSAALAAVFGALWVWLRVVNSLNLINLSVSPLILLFGILAQANLALAVFNLAPGFPLDGGRVFRAALWGWWHDVRRATLWASRAGQAIAVIFVALGGWLVIHDGNLGGVWYGLIAIFLWNAARQGYRQIVIRETLKGVRVEQLMLTDVKTIAPDLSLADFAGDYVAHYRDPVFAVMDGAELLGMISDHHLRRFERSEWRLQRVREAMTPLAQLATLAPSDTAAVALQRLARGNASELPVLQEHALVGVIGENEISRFLRLSR